MVKKKAQPAGGGKKIGRDSRLVSNVARRLRAPGRTSAPTTTDAEETKQMTTDETLASAAGRHTLSVQRLRKGVKGAKGSDLDEANPQWVQPNSRTHRRHVSRTGRDREFEGRDVPDDAPGAFLVHPTRTELEGEGDVRADPTSPLEYSTEEDPQIMRRASASDANNEDAEGTNNMAPFFRSFVWTNPFNDDRDNGAVVSALVVPEAEIVEDEPKLNWYQRRSVLWNLLFLLVIVVLVVIVLVLVLGGVTRSSSPSDGSPGFTEPTPGPSPFPSTTTPVASATSSFAPSSAPSVATSVSPSLAPSDFPSASIEPTSTSSPTATNPFVEIIRSVALMGGAEFDDPESYQSRALQLVLDNPVPPTLGPTLERDRTIQRYGLACILMATNSTPNLLTETEGFLNSSVPPWNDFGNDDDGFGNYLWFGQNFECGWMGIACLNGDAPWAVTRIDLRLKSLTGFFPPETQLFQFLEYIELSDNANLFNDGPELNDFLGNIPSLRTLFYRDTGFRFEEGIPTAIGLLTNLAQYDCSFSRYEGSLQEGIFPSLTNLVNLYIGGNNYGSSIPSDIHMATSLVSIWAQEALLTGDFAFLEGMEALTELRIGGNRGMGGTIPTWFGSFASMKVLVMSDCGLTGAIPTELGQLENLESISLSLNEFVGIPPSELGLIRGLEAIELYGNTMMKGTMPSEICSIETLIEVLVDCPPTGNVLCNCCEDRTAPEIDGLTCIYDFLSLRTTL